MMWIRSSLAYPASFALIMIGFALITGLDFVAVMLMFSHIDSFGGFSLAEMALLYGTAAMALGLADLAIGEIERVGTGSAPARWTSGWSGRCRRSSRRPRTSSRSAGSAGRCRPP